MSAKAFRLAEAALAATTAVRTLIPTTARGGTSPADRNGNPMPHMTAFARNQWYS
jgi:hypothetical protein